MEITPNKRPGAIEFTVNENLFFGTRARHSREPDSH